MPPRCVDATDVAPAGSVLTCPECAVGPAQLGAGIVVGAGLAAAGAPAAQASGTDMAPIDETWPTRAVTGIAPRPAAPTRAAAVAAGDAVSALSTLISELVSTAPLDTY